MSLPAITKRHYYNNVASLLVFASLFAYCVFNLATSSSKGTLLLSFLFVLPLFLVSVRVVRRLIAIRRILDEGRR